MPELPEVETIRRGLEKKIVGLTIKNLQVLNPKSVQFDPELVEGKPFDSAQGLRGRKVLEIWRKAKMLGVNLSGDLSIVFHLKMTGQLIFIPRTINHEPSTRLVGGHPTEDMKGQMPNTSTRVIFEFSDGSKLYFNDQRKFGWIKLFKTSELEADNYKKLGELGPEPLESGFTWELLKEKLLHHKNKPIKVALMDQSVVSGVGNIYASESLFLARIDPRRKVSTLSESEFEKLHQAIIESLETAIKAGGSTRAHFVNIEGERGYFLDYANVYGKEGQKCHGCSGKVEKIQQAGRGTYFCERCQK